MLQKLAGCIIAFYLFIVRMTSRVEVINQHDKPEGRCIFAMWHEQIGYFHFYPYITNKRPLYAMISRHGDGDIINTIAYFFGVRGIRGSSDRQSSDQRSYKSKGGKAVTLEAMKLLKQEKQLTIVADGPKGPAHKAKPGTSKLAASCEAPVIPVSIWSHWHITLNTWDNMHVPLPFTRIVAIMTPTVIVNPGEEKKASEIIENQLNKGTMEAQERLRKRKS